MAVGKSAESVKPLDDEPLRRIAASVPVGFFEADAKGDLVWATPRFLAMAGISEREAIGRGWMNAIDAADRADVARAWDAAVNNPAPTELRFRFVRGESILHARLLLAPVCDTQGSLRSFSVVVTNISEFVDTAARLEESGAQFRVIAEAMPQLAWITDADGTIEYFNKPWLDYTGISVEDTPSPQESGAVHPRDAGKARDLWQAALRTGKPYEVEYRLRRNSDATYRWFIARATPIHDINGKVVRWIGTATDIDAQKRANANLRFVIEASAQFTGCYDVQTVCQRLASVAVERVADWCFIVLREAGAYRTTAVAHRDPVRSRYVQRIAHRYPPHAGGVLDDCVRRNVSLLMPQVDPGQLRAADPEYYQLLESLDMRSVMIVPLASAGTPVYGALCVVSSDSGRTFSSEDLEVSEMVASRAAGAIQTAKAFDEERRRSYRSQLIARASELIFESFNLQTTFDNVTSLIAAETADVAYIMQIEDVSALRIVSFAHHDPHKGAAAARLRGERPLRPQAEERAIQMLAQHRITVQTPFDLQAALSSMWEYLSAHVRALNIRSAITVPLYSRGETLGALVAYWCDTPHTYTEDDVPLFHDLGRRLSIAIEHVNALTRERRIAEALQQALLPTQQMLPQPMDLTFNAEYRPSSDEAEVGGDWYDAVALPDGSIMISVGDVTGRGLRAAGLMGTLRQGINMASMYERDPTRILDDVDFQLRARRSHAIVTAFIGFIDPSHKTLRYANAGHPPPLLRRADELIELRSGAGLPLGLRDAARAEESHTISLEGADLLALYTDGLVEGTHDLAFGEHRLRAVASSQAILYVHNPARFLCDACLPFQAQDDSAVLTVLFRERTHWSFDAENAQAAHDARSQFIEALRNRASQRFDFNAAEVVFGELIGNVVRHAAGPIDVQLDWSGKEPVLHVTDRGRGFIRDPMLPADPLSEGGRGLYIISQLTQSIRIERIPGYGNHVAAHLRT
jgi:PAS domain S-box-containing protein